MKVQLTGLSSLLVRTLNRKGTAVIAGEYTPEDTLQVRGSRLSKSDKIEIGIAESPLRTFLMPAHVRSGNGRRIKPRQVVMRYQHYLGAGEF